MGHMATLRLNVGCDWLRGGHSVVVRKLQCSYEFFAVTTGKHWCAAVLSLRLRRESRRLPRLVAQLFSPETVVSSVIPLNNVLTVRGSAVL